MDKIFIYRNSNTTLVNVKYYIMIGQGKYGIDSNTTLVNVKYNV